MAIVAVPMVWKLCSAVMMIVSAASLTLSDSALIVEVPEVSPAVMVIDGGVMV